MILNEAFVTYFGTKYCKLINEYILTIAVKSFFIETHHIDRNHLAP